MGRDIYHAIQAHILITTFTILDFVVRKKQFTNATCVIGITHVLSPCVWLDNYFQHGHRPRSNLAAITSPPPPKNHSAARNTFFNLHNGAHEQELLGAMGTVT